jgi:hypothetical protein
MARAASDGRKVRLTIDLPARSRERLERLREETEADSLTEVIRRALAVYEQLQRTQRHGGAIILRSRNGLPDRELVIV